MNIGDKIYVLYDYKLESATVVTAGGKKTMLVEFDYPAGYRTRVKREKVAAPTESIAVIWEMWKGCNGRGGYRLERELYEDERMSADQWPWCEYIWEQEHGVLHDRKPPLYK